MDNDKFIKQLSTETHLSNESAKTIVDYVDSVDRLENAIYFYDKSGINGLYSYLSSIKYPLVGR